MYVYMYNLKKYLKIDIFHFNFIYKENNNKKKEIILINI